MKSTRFTLFAILILSWFWSAPLYSAAQQPVIPDRWTAEEAVHFALANSPDTAITRQRIAEAQATVKEADAAFFPQLDVSVGYGRTNNPMYTFGNILNQGAFTPAVDFNHPGISDNLNVTTTINYRLYNGGRDQAGLDAAKAGETASRYDLAAVHSRLGFEVVKTFLTIVQAKEILQARQSAVEAISASVKVARARYEAGDLLKADLLNLEVHQSEAHENLIQARHGLNLTKRAFLNLLGLEQGEVAIAPNCSIEQLLPKDRSFSRRPELQASATAIKAAEAVVRQATGGYYPTADAFASYQVDRGYELDSSGNSWLAGLKVNFNLFEGNRTRARIAKARALLAERKEQRRKLSLAINLEVEKAYLGLEQAEQRLKVTEKMVEQAQESAHLSRERFKEGVILSSELIDVETRLTDALVRRTVARATQRIAVADLRRAVGLPQFNLTGPDDQAKSDSQPPLVENLGK